MFGFAWLLCSTAVGDNKETPKEKTANGLATTAYSQGAQSSMLTAPSVGDIDLGSRATLGTSPPIPSRLSTPNRSQFEAVGSTFEDEKQQLQYEHVLKGLRSMKLSSGEEASSDDWFVVGGVCGNQSNFDTFQGEEDVARRVVKFIAETNNQCQWKVFSREQDSYVAEEMVDKVESKYRQWKQVQINQMVAARRAQQRANSYPRASSFSSNRTGASG